ncbi:Hsp70 family protein [Chloroflexota bacterium]
MIAGIDLGTTNSVMTVLSGGKPVIIPNSEGEGITPSVLARHPRTHEWSVGTPAKRQAVTNPDDSVVSINRVIGRKFTDSIVQDSLLWLPHKVIHSANNDCQVVIGGNEHSPQEISAMILRKLKADAEAYIGDKITEAVIAVPAYFNGNQCRATREAAKIAELEVFRLISETAAASITYGVNSNVEETVAVYHLGGGFFDISIVDMGEGTFQVLSTSGDTRLGGDDFDRRIVRWLTDEFTKQDETELCRDKMMLQMLFQIAEEVKCELSSVHQTEINLPFDSGGKPFSITFTRDKLEELTADLVERTMVICRQAMTDAEESFKKDKRKLKIDRVIMTGGQTRMPLIQEKVRHLFGKPIFMAGNESVAMGAAFLAGVLTGQVKDALLLDAIPLTLGVETVGGVMTPVIPRNHTVPTLASQVFSTSDDNQPTIEVHLTEGENPKAADNESLGRLLFEGVPPAPKGVPQIEVSFSIDANRLLWVTAKDIETDKELNGSGYLWI